MKRLLALAAAAAVLMGGSAGAVMPDLSAPCAVLMEKETGTVLYAAGEREPREIASVTKVMTLLLVMEAIDGGQLAYEDTVTASAHAAAMGGSQIWLEEGEQMTVEELLKAVCIVSGNDASVALAEHLAGSEEAFVARMNARAAELGMEDTHFLNCTGLPAEGQYSCARDVALMSRALIQNHPDLRRFTTVWTDSLRGGASMLVNTNKLLRSYSGATGLKTGSTDAARYCLSATAERDGMELIAAVLAAPTSNERFADARTLLDHGFANYSLLTVTPEAIPAPIPVRLGERPAVQPVLTADNKLLLEKSRAAGLRQHITLAQELRAPVAAGDVVGTLTLSDAAGEEVAALELLAGETVARLGYGDIFLRLLRCSVGAS